MRVGQSRKRDANEAEIVRALEQIGIRCRRLSEKGMPDLLCYSPREGVLLLEVKSATGKLTAAQVSHRQDGWPVCIVRSVADALALFGIVQ